MSSNEYFQAILHNFALGLNDRSIYGAEGVKASNPKTQTLHPLQKNLEKLRPPPPKKKNLENSDPPPPQEKNPWKTQLPPKKQPTAVLFDWIKFNVWNQADLVSGCSRATVEQA